MHGALLLALGLMFAVIGATGCPQPDSLDARKPGQADDVHTGETPSFVLISIDTLRPDHLGVYGYARPTSPQIDAFARDSVVFEEAISSSASTLTAHASIFTSLTPARHGAFFSRSAPLGDDRLTVAEVLRDAGWRTLGLHAGGKVAAELGLAQGFQRYERVLPLFADTVASACTSIDETAGEPFFLFLHTYEVHHPYTPADEYLSLFKDEAYSGPLPDEIGISEHLRPINSNRPENRMAIGPSDLAHIIATYDAEIRSMDDAFGTLRDCLLDASRYHDTMIILTSDHGEEFDEHGVVGWHSHTLYDELVRVPLIIKWPNGRFAGQRIATMVRSLDIAPTIVAGAGLAVPQVFEGAPLEALVGGGRSTGADYVLLQRDSRRRRPDSRAIRTAEWKLFGRKLFDLVHDATEQRDVAAAHPEVVDALSSRLRAGFRAERPPRPPEDGAQLDDQTRAELRALGYVEQ
jgi:arylsulfatase A-like enzyme